MKTIITLLMAATIAVACDLGALSADGQARRSALASRVAARFREVLELSNGYAVRLDPDSAIIRGALDWLLLERSRSSTTVPPSHVVDQTAGSPSLVAATHRGR